MVKISVTDEPCARKIGPKKIAPAAALPEFRELRTRRRRQGIALPSEFSDGAARHLLIIRLCFAVARRKGADAARTPSRYKRARFGEDLWQSVADRIFLSIPGRPTSRTASCGRWIAGRSTSTARNSVPSPRSALPA